MTKRVVIQRSQFINNLRMARHFCFKLTPLVNTVPFALTNQIGAIS